MDETEFDAVVVGAGPGGEVAAGRLADAGLSVAIVEADKVGGECSYYACMPSKALLRPGELLIEARRVPGAAAAVTGPVDVGAVLRRRDEIIGGRGEDGGLRDDGQLPWLEEHGITLFRGRGRLIGDRRVAVGDTVLRARRAVILAGGTRAALPPIDGLADARPWTNREATTAREVPGSLVVIGGGVVGTEMSQAYRSLGAAVTLVAGNRGLLPREEAFVGEQVGASLVEQGVDLRTGRRAVSVRREGERVTVVLDDGAELHADEVLVAAGRVPQSAGLGLAEVGVETEGFVKVDERMRVPGLEWLYVIGDLNGRALFTHMAKYQAAVAASDVLGSDIVVEHLADGPGAPRVVFTEPQVASVGHTAASAREAGLRVRVVDVPTDGNAGGAFTGATRGTARFLVDEDAEVLVGATITGTGVADMLQAATIAIVGEVPVRRLRHAVPAFPTRSEVWLHLFDALGV
ncbi:dihydrolipoyl dehydrogenase family protein [Nocardiopsis changdeensis]|uniref:NAD(P)/FAD-dependent oxidoreductase n=1 Tax=Nocardiopsis changdeensis TaxID=2831969 RepID=A0ABX8BU87_9ACTN|nr:MULTISPECIES: NAD(P)/FAD-dependent oxidoreductase [Nocardiopsis]QUX25255.1 NAD(P)/FAD-dependent oxidoreductase [Nocardiopsis changdeensis]QYX35642.1 NAD(P)/FAD-dependent oxidoreductase [Nocardiopsis sp. MT53]